MRRAVSRLPAKLWWAVAAIVVLLGAGVLGGGLVARATHDFPDVPDGAFYHDDVTWIKDRNVTLGCGGGNYCPNDFVTRGQMAAFLHRMGTGGSPRAFAFINTDGTKASGTSNVSSLWNAASKWYEITITGESYFFTSFATLVTPSAICTDAIARTDSFGGKLLVRIWDVSAADHIQCGFQFATFEP